MEITVTEWSQSSFVSITVTHDGEPPLLFDSGGYRTTRMVQRTFNDDEDVVNDELFNHLNEYLARLPKETQAELYGCYAMVDTLLRDYDVNADNGSSSIGNQTIENDLIEVVKRIHELATVESMFQYIQGNRSLKIPLELSNTYDTEDKITPAYVAKTYTLAEYMDLMTVVLGLRFMLPIWGPYLKIIGVADSFLLKEYNAFGLLAKSALYAHPAFDRMETYIWANTDKKDLNLAPILHFISEERLPTYAIAMTAVRKLAIAPLSNETEKHHLMKILYSYAKNKIIGLGRQLEPGLLSKDRVGSAYEDDNSSVLCNYKLKEQLSIGDLAVFRVFLDNYQVAAARIDDTISPEMVELCVTNARNLVSTARKKSKRWRPTAIQKGLVAWALSPAIAGAIIPLLSRRDKSLDTAMGIAQAVLWHWGFLELAIMVTASVHGEDETTFRGGVSKMRISDNTMEELEAIYTYKAPAKTSPGRGGVTNGTHNTGVRGVEYFHSQLAGCDWTLQCPKELGVAYGNAHIPGFIEPSPTLREELAKLLIKLDVRMSGNY